MKKRILSIALTLAVLVGIFFPITVLASTIAYVDFELLFYAHPEYDVKNKELQDKIEELYIEAQEQAQQLETQEEIDELGLDYEWQFEQIEQDVRVELVSFILKIIEKIAEESEISVVLPESSIIYGGRDITVQVVEAMYKAYGISVPSSLRDLLQ